MGQRFITTFVIKHITTANLLHSETLQRSHHDPLATHKDTGRLRRTTILDVGSLGFEQEDFISKLLTGHVRFHRGNGKLPTILPGRLKKCRKFLHHVF